MKSYAVNIANTLRYEYRHRNRKTFKAKHKRLYKYWARAKTGEKSPSITTHSRMGYGPFPSI